MNSQPESISFPKPLKIIAYFISVVFHPLFIPLYGAWYIIFVHPVFFVGITSPEKYWILLRVFINMVFFQGLAVLLLKAVGFIDTIFLKTQRDRIIPYITAGIFYFWTYLVFKNQPSLPSILTAFVFGAFTASYVALIANIYLKVSMHAIGVGALLGLLFIILKSTNSTVAIPVALMITLLISGLVCTSRLLISDHSTKEIYTGLFIGFACQLIAAMWIL